MAERLGTPLMPWQQLIADVGGELVEDPATGRLIPAYREVIVSVPRQNGKTALVLAWEIQRANAADLWGGPQRIVYTAQNATAARKKLVGDHFPIINPRKARFGIEKCRIANGDESVEFKNGSRIGLMASSVDSGHGQTIDLAIKDELFADYDDRRDQALIPAMATRVAAQAVTVSTMGTDESVVLNRAVDRGRLSVEAGQLTGVAYFEWSADLDADPDDPATWWACMPALGYTVTEPVIAHARATLADGEFRRAFLNQRTKAEDRVLPSLLWDAANSPNYAPSGPLCFAVDINPERDAGSIVAASGGDVPTAELVDHRAGTGWLVSRVVELANRNAGAKWAIDVSGPAGSLIPELERAGVSVHPTTPRELIEACGQLYDGVVERRYRFNQTPALDLAAAVAAKRSVGDSWAWTRKHAVGDISPLVAATLALWLATNPAQATNADFFML